MGLALVLRAFGVSEAFEQFQIKAKLPAFLTESLLFGLVLCAPNLILMPIEVLFHQMD